MWQKREVEIFVIGDRRRDRNESEEEFLFTLFWEESEREAGMMSRPPVRISCGLSGRCSSVGKPAGLVWSAR